MRGLPLSRFSGGFGSGMQRRASHSCRSTASATAGTSASKASLSAYAKAGITCGALSTVGDLLAQTLAKRHARGGSLANDIDFLRTARMASFGLFFYGPLQHRWYGLLASRFPGTSTQNFVSKVALNQLALGPVVLAVSFAWNLVLTGQASNYVSKLRNDGPPTMVNGWKFWVPASGVNFWLVPLRLQVLYMSTCGMLWTGYLSYASNK